MTTTTARITRKQKQPRQHFQKKQAWHWIEGQQQRQPQQQRQLQQQLSTTLEMAPLNTGPIRQQKQDVPHESRASQTTKKALVWHRILGAKWLLRSPSSPNPCYASPKAWWQRYDPHIARECKNPFATRSSSALWVVSPTGCASAWQVACLA